MLGVRGCEFAYVCVSVCMCDGVRMCVHIRRKPEGHAMKGLDIHSQSFQ